MTPLRKRDASRASVSTVARACAMCGASGAFNLAWPERFSWKALARSRHRHAVGLPPAWFRASFWLAWRTTGWGGEPGWLAGADRSLTLDCARARDVLGWAAMRDPFGTAGD